MLFSAVVLLVLILVSGVLASSEIAVSSSNRNRVKMQADGGDKRAARLLATKDDPHSFFATTQLYYTFIGFFSGAYAASSFTGPLVDLSRRLGLPVPENVAEPLMFILITAILTYVSLILGELVPKRIAMQYAIPYSLRILPVLNVLSILALPFVKLLSASSKLVLKLIGIKDDNAEEDITKDEIRMIVEAGSEHGHIAKSEQGMIENIFGFDRLTAGDVCTHRPDVIALPIDADFKTVVDVWTSENYTRVPVYEKNRDDICGILHSKDMLHYLVNGSDVSDFNIRSLMREAYFVPLSKKADELFQDMRREQVYIAVVIDEYGGTLGIVTMEDLVEKIVGSIQDEYDIDEMPDVVPIDDYTFQLQGTTPLETVQSRFGVQLPVDEYETLSGFLVGQLGYIPTEDEQPRVDFDGLIFKVEMMQKKRIASVILELPKGL